MNSHEYIKEQLRKPNGLLRWFRDTQNDEIFDGICDLVEHAYSDGKHHTEMARDLADHERFLAKKNRMTKLFERGLG